MDWPQQTRVKWISVELELLRGKRERTEREGERELPNVVSSCLITGGIRKRLNLCFMS